jgi:hypothetical protein
MRQRRRGSALLFFVLALVLLVALVGLALDSGLGQHREESQARARALAREAAEAGASRCYLVLRDSWTATNGFTAAIAGGNCGWPSRQFFGFGAAATWQPLVVNNADGGGATDVDNTCVLYVTGRAAAPSGGDALYTLVKVLGAGADASGPSVLAAGAAGTTTFAGPGLISVDGANGRIFVNGTLDDLVGTVTASQELAYGKLGLVLGSLSAPLLHAETAPYAPATATAAVAFAAPSIGDKYELAAGGQVFKNGVSLGTFATWSGWTYLLGTWTHLLGSEFTPSPGGAGTVYSALPMNVLGGPTDLVGNPAPRDVTLLSGGAISITGAVNLAGATPGLAVLTDQSLTVTVALGGVTFGSATNPSFVIAGGNLLLTGLAGGIAVNGRVIANGSATLLATLGTIAIHDNAPPAFIPGKPTLRTLFSYEATADPSVKLPVDAAQGSLGVYR